MDLIAVVNAGSSSIKFSLFQAIDGQLQRMQRGQIERLPDEPQLIIEDPEGKIVGQRQWNRGELPDREAATEQLLNHLLEQTEGHRLLGVGHRVVHGGQQFTEPVAITDQVLQQLFQLVPLAPLHQHHNLAPIAIFRRRVPEVPQFACFDTAFHRTLPELARMFGLPHAYQQRGVRRFGFHGLSYEYIAGQLNEVDPAAAAGRTVVLHLGNGASMCALRAGQSIATTMGFSCVDGLLMGTRCGRLDPGVILYLMQHDGLNSAEIEDLLYRQSGLRGVSGISSDMRALLESDQPGARRAIDLYVYRIACELGSLSAALGGLDALVFTAGIGENAVEIRADVCRQAEWLGVEIDDEANRRGGPRISREGSAIGAWVIPTNEQWMIAHHVQQQLGKEEFR